MNLAARQSISGLVAPETAEALIREAWPSVAAYPAIASFGRFCIQSYVLAPLGWFLMLPVYFLKILPFVATRYTLTNRRVMIRRGLLPVAAHEVALAQIDQVNLMADSNSDFYRSATLEIISGGKVLLALKGVPEPEGFRHAIWNAVKAWVPAKAAGLFVPASATGST